MKVSLALLQILPPLLQPFQQQIQLQESVNKKWGLLIRQFLLLLQQLKHQLRLFCLYHLRQFLLPSLLAREKGLSKVSKLPARKPSLEEFLFLTPDEMGTVAFKPVFLASLYYATTSPPVILVHSEFCLSEREMPPILANALIKLSLDWYPFVMSCPKPGSDGTLFPSPLENRLHSACTSIKDGYSFEA